MKDLKQIQKIFIKDLFSKKISGKYISPHNLSSLQLIQIYQNNFFSTHIDSLKKSYPKVLKIIGEQAFKQIARNYIKARAPQNESIQNYGERFNQFIKKDCITKTLLYLPDVAKAEHLLNLSYYCKNDPALCINEFAKWQKKDVLLNGFSLHLSCYLMQSPYPVDKIMQLTKLKNLYLKENKEFYFLIFRRKFFSQILGLSKENFAFLTGINNNKTILNATADAIKINKNFNLQKSLLFFLNQQSFALKKQF